MRFSPATCCFFLLGPKWHPLYPFLWTFCLCSSLDVTDQAVRPYKTTGNLIILRVLIFSSVGNKTRVLDAMVAEI